MSDLEGKPIVTGDANTSNLFPAWFIEGTANFVGFSVSALAFDTTYWQGYEAMFNYAPPEESINKNSNHNRISLSECIYFQNFKS
jgi:hypothetical protein